MKFIRPKKRYYFGKTNFGCPYFYPRNYVKSIIYFKKCNSKIQFYGRFKSKIIKIFGREHRVGIGYPIVVKKLPLGFKDKYDSPRHEWNPQFHIYFFGLQFAIWWGCPFKENDDLYWEMWLWAYHYNDGNIQKAEETWGWVDYETKQSTWNKNYIINE